MQDQSAGSIALLERLMEDDESLLDSHDPKVEAVLIERLYQNSWATRYTPIPMLFGAFVIYRDFLSWWDIVGLTALYLGTTLYMDRLRDAFAESRGGGGINWALRFTVGCGSTGLTWGLLGWLAYPPGDFALQALICVAWGGLATSTLNTRAVYLPAFYAFMITMSVPLFTRGFLFGEPSTVIMAFFGVILFTAMCFCAQVNNKRERIGMALRLRHAELIAELDQGRAMAESRYQKMEDRYFALQADFNALQQMTRRGYWRAEIQSGDVVWSDETYRLLGLEPQSCPAALAAWLDRVHPDDRAMIRGHYRNLRQGLPAPPAPLEFRLLDGKTRLQTTGEAIRGEDGELVRIQGVVQPAAAQIAVARSSAA